MWTPGKRPDGAETGEWESPRGERETEAGICTDRKFSPARPGKARSPIGSQKVRSTLGQFSESFGWQSNDVEG
jgi:hypothetical protein